MNESTAQTYEFFATCAAGFESLLAGEISGLGITSPRTLTGQIAFTSTLEDAYRVCLWSRIASRVILVLGHIDVPTSDALYQNLANFFWEDHLPLTATFAIDAHGTNDQLRSTQFIAQRAKDAICDHILAKIGGRPSIDTKNPDIRVVVRVRQNRATVGLDLSGTPLFRRNLSNTVRPDYAAALLATGGWYRCCRKDEPVLVSIFPGNGTVMLEAAQIALKQAPGLLRNQWGFSKWLGHDADAWNRILTEAKKQDNSGVALKLIAVDENKQGAFEIRHTLTAMGISVAPTIVSSAQELEDALQGVDDDGLLTTIDFSWLDKDSLVKQTSTLNSAQGFVEMLHNTTNLVALAPTRAFEEALGLNAKETHDIILGRNTARICLYSVEKSTEKLRPTITLKNGTVLPVFVSASDQFAARLAKVAKLRTKWARKEDVTCYRVYDADLPDYAVAIDLYQASYSAYGRDKGKRWLVIQEYAAPKTVDPEIAHKRLLDVVVIAPYILNVKTDDVFVRVRQHAKGGSQYADGGKNSFQASNQSHPTYHLIDEGGLVFEVNFTEHLDTGIFLDHRDVRAQVREMAKQTFGSKRFLNLFAYTGTATCYAADGGAKHTTTVDLSSTYLDWAQRNMKRNGFVGPEHEYVRADVVRWISEQRRTPNRWDLVFCDPPTFSNSKKMGRNAFDIQRDHAELLIGISRLLTRNGVCLFSCNLRGFAPDTEKLARAGVAIEDITEGTIPEDFARNAKIHHCYLVTRTPREDSQAPIPQEVD